MLLLLFAGRAVIASDLQVAYLYTPEVGAINKSRYNQRYRYSRGRYNCINNKFTITFCIVIKGVNPCSNMGWGIILGRNIHPAFVMYCVARSAPPC